MNKNKTLLRGNYYEEEFYKSNMYAVYLTLVRRTNNLNASTTSTGTDSGSNGRRF